MKTAVIGGGIMGITLGYYLAQAGIEVEIFEASPVLGGLAGPLTLPDGTDVDRFYHAILSSDSNLQELCQKVGISDQFRFKETRMGFYFQGKIHSMNNVVEFLRFPPLGWIDRFRLGLTVLAAQFIRDWHKLEGISVEDWLVRLSGRKTFDNIWKPMLKAKFDGGFSDTPATYIWSRLVRMKSTRGGANQKEMSGHLIGGYATLLKALAEQIQAAGGVIHLNTPIEKVIIENDQAIGLLVYGERKQFDRVVATVQAPIFSRLIPDAPAAYRQSLEQGDYLGIICPLLVLERPLTGFWTLNITDETVPFTGVIETTAYIDPAFVGGHHLVYLPKYTAPGSAWQKMPDEEIRAIWMKHLVAMFPGFSPDQARYFLVHRERFVEPIHRLNSTEQIPEVVTPVRGLFLSTTAQIYPALTNGESVTRHARATAQVVAQGLSTHAGDLVRSTHLETEPLPEGS